jgi:hypothetical protein
VRDVGDGGRRRRPVLGGGHPHARLVGADAARVEALAVAARHPLDQVPGLVGHQQPSLALRHVDRRDEPAAVVADDALGVVDVEPELERAVVPPPIGGGEGEQRGEDGRVLVGGGHRLSRAASAW